MILPTKKLSKGLKLIHSQEWGIKFIYFIDMVVQQINNYWLPDFSVTLGLIRGKNWEISDQVQFILITILKVSLMFIDSIKVEDDGPHNEMTFMQNLLDQWIFYVFCLVFRYAVLKKFEGLHNENRGIV